jgi:hypothetical protein
MVFKQKDSLDQQLERLQQRLKECSTKSVRQRLEKEIAQMLAGAKGEQDTAYYIDFELKDSKSWAVIHDLRLEWNGRVAQIDHLLISRLLEIYVVESKSFRSKIRFENGGWERLNFREWEGIPSPVDQNDRHILVLKELIQKHKLAPTRFGLNPSYFNIVAVQPSCSIVGKLPKDARVFKTDGLVKKVRDMTPSALDTLNMVSPETLKAFGQALCEHHRPAPDLSLSRFPAIQTARPSAAILACQNCGGDLSKAEALYCRNRQSAFAGFLLCRKCQSYARKPSSTATTINLPQKRRERAIVARCAKCNGRVDGKVVAFCRFNSKKFSGRLLCRDCQGVHGVEFNTLAKMDG